MSREDVYLLARRHPRSLSVGQASTGLIDRAARLLGVLHGARALLGKAAVAVDFMVGERRFSLGRLHCRFGLGNQRVLAFKRGAGIGALCLGYQQLRLRSIQRGLVVTRVDGRQQLASRDLLIVFHQHLLDETGDFGRDHGVVGGHIGVIGALAVIAAKHPGADDAGQDGHGQHRADEKGFAVVGHFNGSRNHPGLKPPHAVDRPG